MRQRRSNDLYERFDCSIVTELIAVNSVPNADGARGEGLPGPLANRNSIPPSGDRSVWLPDSFMARLNCR